MKKLVAAAVAAFALSSPLVAAQPATAQQDIGWFWNSGDRDVQAKFQAEGEWFHAKEVGGTGYLRWSVSGSGYTAWDVPGSDDNTLNKSNQTYKEGKVVKLRSCERWNNLPDDCSGYRTGVS